MSIQSSPNQKFPDTIHGPSSFIIPLDAVPVYVIPLGTWLKSERIFGDIQVPKLEPGMIIIFHSSLRTSSTQGEGWMVD